MINTTLGVAVQYRGDNAEVYSFVARMGGTILSKKDQNGTVYYTILAHNGQSEWLLMPGNWIVALGYGQLGTMSEDMYKKFCKPTATEF